jgi:hypothetical protein
MTLFLAQENFLELGTTLADAKLFKYLKPV